MMPKHLDPRTFLTPEKLHSLKATTGMDETAIAQTFQEVDGLLKDSPPTRRGGSQPIRSDGRLWELMGVLGADCEDYIPRLRSERMKALSGELRLRPLFMKQPALAEFIEHIDSVRVSPGIIEAFGQYADNLRAPSGAHPAIKGKGIQRTRSDDLAGLISQAAGGRFEIQRNPEAPYDETAQSLYHKIELLSSLKKWASGG
jgi:hypothetical protein